MSLLTRSTIGLLGLTVLAGSARGQLVQGQATLTDDRWMYPFNATPGTQLVAKVFGAALFDGFDDYDGQFLIGFDTTGLVPAGLGPGQYHIESAVVRVVPSNDLEYRFDPTFDPFASHLDPGDPDFIPDADPGRPIELFAAAYRGDLSPGVPFDALNWTEDQVFGGVPVVQPAQGARYVYNAVFDLDAAPIDLSNRIKNRVDLESFAVGNIPGVNPGEFVPADSEILFDVNPCIGGADAFMRRSLDQGILRLTVGSTHDSTGGPGGNITFPILYTRENPIAQALGFQASLELRVRIGSGADLTGTVDPNSPGFGVPDGTVDANDFFYYLALFADGDRRADLSGSANPLDPAYGQPNCSIDANDFFFFLDQFVQG